MSGKFWNVNKDHLYDQETNTLYKCTVQGYQDFNKWSGRGILSQTMEMQEMGVDGQVSTEPHGSNNDKIFFMKYPLHFLQYWSPSFPVILVPFISCNTPWHSRRQRPPGHHRHFSWFPLICWCRPRHDRGISVRQILSPSSHTDLSPGRLLLS